MKLPTNVESGPWSAWFRRRSVETWPSAIAFVVAVVMLSPALAGGFANKARGELTAFGAHAGYIAATIVPCGGDEAEVGYFTGQVRKMLDAIGGDEGDFAIVAQAMATARAKAKPGAQDCTDEGGMDLAGKLSALRDAVRDAAQ